MIGAVSLAFRFGRPVALRLERLHDQRGAPCRNTVVGHRRNSSIRRAAGSLCIQGFAPPPLRSRNAQHLGGTAEARLAADRFDTLAAAAVGTASARGRGTGRARRTIRALRPVGMNS
jgi:hypothetical protein